MIGVCLAEKCNIPFIAVGTVDANTPQRSKIRDAVANSGEDYGKS